jgi:phosphoglucosamine mutase
MAEALADVQLFPQVMLNVKVKPGSQWQTNAQLQLLIKEVEQELGETGRVLIRASGTEPVVRVMVESPDAKQTQTCAERLAAVL